MPDWRLVQPGGCMPKTAGSEQPPVRRALRQTQWLAPVDHRGSTRTGNAGGLFPFELTYEKAEVFEMLVLGNLTHRATAGNEKPEHGQGQGEGMGLLTAAAGNAPFSTANMQQRRLFKC